MSAPDHPSRRHLLRAGIPLILYAMLICLRMPDIIIHGRFWAEEGKPFFQNAWTMPPAAALFTSYGGYLNLIANAAPLAARWLVPLPLAPYVTTATGLFFQLCPPLLILTARDAWLRPLRIRIVALLLLLLVPATEEVWLQTLHCQFELLLCGGIILALDIAVGWRSVLRLALLILAPLCGPVAIALIPLFILRAALDRSRPRLVQALALGAAGLVQLLLFFHPVAGRGYVLHPVLLLCVFTIRHLALPFLGVGPANVIVAAIRARLHAGQVPAWAMALPVLVFSFLLAASLWRRPARPAFWLLSAGGLIAIACYVGAIGGVDAQLADVRGGGRYDIVPQSLLYLSVLALGSTSSGRMRAAYGAIIIWLLAIGAAAYFRPFTLVAEGPSWRREVALWQADPTHALQIWPRGWTITLPPPQANRR